MEEINASQTDSKKSTFSTSDEFGTQLFLRCCTNTHTQKDWILQSLQFWLMLPAFSISLVCTGNFQNGSAVLWKEAVKLPRVMFTQQVYTMHGHGTHSKSVHLVDVCCLVYCIPALKVLGQSKLLLIIWQRDFLEEQFGYWKRSDCLLSSLWYTPQG